MAKKKNRYQRHFQGHAHTFPSWHRHIQGESLRRKTNDINNETINTDKFISQYIITPVTPITEYVPGLISQKSCSS